MPRANRSKRSRKRPRRGLLTYIERLLWLIAVCLLGWVAYVALDAQFYQARAERALDAARQQVDFGPPEAADRSEAPLDLQIGDPIGRIEIPRLDLSVVAAEGADDGVLRRSVGHLPGTPLPGAGGNAAFAGHRDRHFRDLRNVADGDEILVETPEGAVRYRVEWTRVVSPDDLSVLEPTLQPSLTLITCYPFDFIGPAPERFVVRARQIESAAGTRPAA